MFWILTLLFCVILLYFYSMLGVGLVSARHARELIAIGEVRTIIDVRTPGEFSMGHYPGATNIPVNRISQESTSRIDRDGILVYCNTGQRARYAAQKLRELGFQKVYYIAGTYQSLLLS